MFFKNLKTVFEDFKKFKDINEIFEILNVFLKHSRNLNVFSETKYFIKLFKNLKGNFFKYFLKFLDLPDIKYKIEN